MKLQSSFSPALPGFGSRLRNIRRACNYKQAYIAHLAGVDQATVSRWERGIVSPEPARGQALLNAIRPINLNDSTLRCLVESSSLTVHLVTDIDHVLLAASQKREKEWGVPIQELRGRSVWAAASPAIQIAESQLEYNGWWDEMFPAPVSIELEEFDSGFLPIIPGRMLWERVWLSDGRPARLCTLQQ